MKKIFISTIRLYKQLVSPILDLFFGKGNTCRFEMNCSDYAVAAISKYGVIKGTGLAAVRIAHCHPLSSNTAKYESI